MNKMPVFFMNLMSPCTISSLPYLSRVAQLPPQDPGHSTRCPETEFSSNLPGDADLKWLLLHWTKEILID